MTGPKLRLQKNRRLKFVTLILWAAMMVLVFLFDETRTNWVDYVLLVLFALILILSVVTAGNAFTYMHRWWMQKK
jgi:membrane protein YdbS with pleckstrin-like domain